MCRSDTYPYGDTANLESTDTVYGNGLDDIKSLFGFVNDKSTLVYRQIFVTIIGQAINAAVVIVIAHPTLKYDQSTASIITQHGSKTTVINGFIK